MTKRVVCFVNRRIGSQIAMDLATKSGVELVAVVTNDPPLVDLDVDSSSSGILVTTWSEFVSQLDSKYLDLDYGVAALFRHRLPASVLASFSEGVVNLHPSLLPYGRGSVPATWAIWEESPYGASAHLMTEVIDEGPILAQREIAIAPDDTSYSLYEKALDTLRKIYETDVASWLSGESITWRNQALGGSSHTRRDLLRLAALDPKALSSEAKDRLFRALSLTAARPELGSGVDET